MRFSFLAVAFSAMCLSLTAPSHAGADAAGKYVEGLGNQALAAISDKSASKEKKQAVLDKLFKDNVDIPWVGRFVMGRYWREASEQQKADYLREYEAFIIKHYTSRFTEYTSGTFKVTDAKDDGDNEYTVSMQLQGESASSEPVLVDYRLRNEKGAFKIFDVIVEGVSLITTQRSEFASVISHHGIDHLIAQLKNKSLPISEPK